VTQAPGKALDQIARDQIRRWIRTTGITQTDLATRIGRTQAWLSRYLKGEFAADLDTLQLLAGVFEHSLGTLLSLPAEPEEADVLQNFRALDPDARKHFLALLALMARPRSRGRGPNRRLRQ
jgi:transcriptional regulator with XRE-family HTH domain